MLSTFATAPAGARNSFNATVATLHRREPRLARFGFALLALTVAFAFAASLDHRTIRDVGVWVKPMKFALSIAAMSLTTAWFAGHLPAAVRGGAAMRRIVRIVVWTGGAELAYIAIQAALGQPSHYNGRDAFHATLFSLMGVGAVCLTATQPMLAWLLWRHPDPSLPAAYRQAILFGLALTFVFGAGVGALLAGRQPTTGGSVLPLLGWSLAGDLRPAHFVGIHAAQLLPLAGFVASVADPRRAATLVWIAAVGYTALFVALVAIGLRPVVA